MVAVRCPLPFFGRGALARRRGLAEVGFSQGRDVTVEYHLADGHPERLSALAADLVRRRPAAIIAAQGISALAAKAATQDIPIIFVDANAPEIPIPPDAKTRFTTKCYASCPQCYPQQQVDPDTNLSLSWQALYV